MRLHVITIALLTGIYSLIFVYLYCMQSDFDRMRTEIKRESFKSMIQQDSQP